MDPDETLRQLREAIAEERAAEYEYDLERYEEIMTLVEALDGWLTRGGYWPSQWERN